MAYDPVSKKVVLFGGAGQTVDLNDTWTFDGTNWTQQVTGGCAAGAQWRGHGVRPGYQKAGYVRWICQWAVPPGYMGLGWRDLDLVAGADEVLTPQGNGGDVV